MMNSILLLSFIIHLDSSSSTNVNMNVIVIPNRYKTCLKLDRAIIAHSLLGLSCLCLNPVNYATCDTVTVENLTSIDFNLQLFRMLTINIG